MEAIFECCREYQKSLRERKHKGIAIEHKAHDRATHAKLSRMWNQWTKLMAGEWSIIDEDNDSEWLQLLEWNVDTGCALHDTSIALEIALMLVNESHQFRNVSSIFAELVAVLSLQSQQFLIGRAQILFGTMLLASQIV